MPSTRRRSNKTRRTKPQTSQRRAKASKSTSSCNPLVFTDRNLGNAHSSRPTLETRPQPLSSASITSNSCGLRKFCDQRYSHLYHQPTLDSDPSRPNHLLSSNIATACDVPIASPRPLKAWPHFSLVLERLETPQKLGELQRSSSRLESPRPPSVLSQSPLAPEYPHKPGCSIADAIQGQLGSVNLKNPLVPLEDSWFALHPFQRTGSHCTISLGPYCYVPVSCHGLNVSKSRSSSASVPSTLPSLHTKSSTTTTRPIPYSDAETKIQDVTQHSPVAKLLQEMDRINWCEVDFEEIVDALESNVKSPPANIAAN
jgi:hypothetical protein